MHQERIRRLKELAQYNTPSGERARKELERLRELCLRPTVAQLEAVKL